MTAEVFLPQCRFTRGFLLQEVVTRCLCLAGSPILGAVACPVTSVLWRIFVNFSVYSAFCFLLEQGSQKPEVPSVRFVSSVPLTPAFFVVVLFFQWRKVKMNCRSFQFSGFLRLHFTVQIAWALKQGSWFWLSTLSMIKILCFYSDYFSSLPLLYVCKMGVILWPCGVCV